MTKTIQSYSSDMSGISDKELTEKKSETEYDTNLLLSVCDRLNNLSKALTKMNSIQNKLCNKLLRLDNILTNNDISKNIILE